LLSSVKKEKKKIFTVPVFKKKNIVTVITEKVPVLVPVMTYDKKFVLPK
jgi:hypothetical protein